MTKAEQLIANLYTARKERAEAKRLFEAKEDEIGECEYDRMPDFMGDEEGVPPCIQQGSDVSRYCDHCKAVHPFRTDYWRKANGAGAALRAALREGKRLSEEVEN